MPEVFTILDDGETLITGEWVPDPDDVAARLIQLSGRLENMHEVMIAARQIAIESTEAHFDSQSDPQGNPWAALSPDYEFQKGKDGYPTDEILVRTGAGKDAATSEEAYFISEDSIWFNPGLLPDYMSYHQSGTAVAGHSEALSRIASKTATSEDLRIASQGAGKGKALPQREFIGFDEVDILTLEELFNTWFRGTIIEEFPTTGFGTHSGTKLGVNMLGEFPIISYTKRGQPILRTPGGPRFGRL